MTQLTPLVCGSKKSNVVIDTWLINNIIVDTRLGIFLWILIDSRVQSVNEDSKLFLHSLTISAFDTRRSTRSMLIFMTQLVLAAGKLYPAIVTTMKVLQTRTFVFSSEQVECWLGCDNITESVQSVRLEVVGCRHLLAKPRSQWNS